MTDFQRDLEVIINEVGIKNNGNIRFFMRHMERMKDGIEYLGLSDRAYNAMRRNNINTIQDITNKFDQLKVKGAGEKVIKEVRNKYFQYYYSQLNEEERKEFWRDTIRETEALAGDVEDVAV